MFRFERKFVGESFEEFLQINSLLNNSKNRIKFAPLHKTRIINNIYFDDHYNTSLYENIDGTMDKRKVRLRWYNNDTSHCRLEIKGKKGDYGSKEIIEVILPKLKTKVLINLLGSKNKFIELLKKYNEPFVIEQVWYLLKTLIVVSYNDYQRKYYHSSKAKIRMTIDNELRFINLRNGKIEEKEYNYFLNVYEFKFLAEDIQTCELFEKFIANFPSRITKFSKFAYSSNSYYSL